MKVLSAILLLGLAICASSETCPSSQDVYPCSCEEDDYSGDITVDCDGGPNSLEEFKNVLNSLSGKKDVAIVLYDLYLGKVPPGLFNGIGVKKLHVSHCNLTIGDDKPVLSGLEDTLEELEIISIFTDKNAMIKLKFGHLHHLRVLHLYWNTISELGNDWFEDGPSSLEDLALIGNGIKKIGDRVFANLNNLVLLFLKGNRFGEIKRSMFPSSAHALGTLELDANELESIPEDLFSGMPSLTDLSLYHNRIRRLEKNTWEEVWEQLDFIYILNNPLHCDSHMDWMFDMRSTFSIYGRCESPQDQHGKDLLDFIESGRQ